MKYDLTFFLNSKNTQHFFCSRFNILNRLNFFSDNLWMPFGGCSEIVGILL
jgi:hypothetical protein